MEKIKIWERGLYLPKNQNKKKKKHFLGWWEKLEWTRKMQALVGSPGSFSSRLSPPKTLNLIKFLFTSREVLCLFPRYGLGEIASSQRRNSCMMYQAL